jgi:putative restriction endonuclease
VLLEAGRSVGLEPDRLPDVLGSESGTFDAVLDADRVSTAELIVSVEGEVREWHDAHPGSDLSTTEKLMLGSARVGQKRFAFSVLNNCDFECVFCGLGFRSVGLPPSRMLVAGHIKSWSASDNRERLDVRNGLAACPTHDAAFDTFLISLSDDLRVLRTDALESARQMDAAVDRNFGAAGMRERIRFSESATPPSSDYLAWHRARSLQEIGGYAYG